jgi:hypothetical protein
MATTTTTTSANKVVHWHVIAANAVSAVIGLLGYFQPGVPNDGTVRTVVPAAAAIAIAIITAFFVSSPNAVDSQIQTVGNEVIAAATPIAQSVVPAADQATLTSVLDALSTTLADLKTATAPTTTTTKGTAQ